MEGSLTDLSIYRFQKALDCLGTAEILLDAHRLEGSIDRSYYAIFHALRAVTILDGFDSSKHSGIISYFNLHYVKSGIFDKDVSSVIDMAYRARHRADYQDLYVATEEQARELFEDAVAIVEMVTDYLPERWEVRPEGA